MNNRSRVTDQEDRLTRLAQRVEADAQVALRGYRANNEWIEPFTRLAPWLIPVAAAALVALVFVPPPPEPGTPTGSIIEQSIRPTDQTGALFVLASQPPPGPTLFGWEEP